MVVQHNMTAANQQRSYLLVTESTVQQMMQQDSQFQRR